MDSTANCNADLQKEVDRSFSGVHLKHTKFFILILTYLLIAVGLPSGGSSIVHIYTQTIHRTTQLTTLVGRLSGIRTQSGQTKINDDLTA